MLWNITLPIMLCIRWQRAWERKRMPICSTSGLWDTSIIIARNSAHFVLFCRTENSISVRSASGTELEPSPGFHEGNSWNYTFYVPHDVKGLARLMGGQKKLSTNCRWYSTKVIMTRPMNRILLILICSVTSRVRNGVHRKPFVNCWLSTSLPT